MEKVNDLLIEELINNGFERALYEPYFIIYSYYPKVGYDSYSFYPTKCNFRSFKTENELKESLKSFSQDQWINIKGVYKGNYNDKPGSFKKLDYEIIVNFI